MNKIVLSLLETFLIILDLFGVFFWNYYASTKATRSYQDAGAAAGGLGMIIVLLILSVIILTLGLGIGVYRSTQPKSAQKSLSTPEKLFIGVASVLAIFSFTMAKFAY